MAKVSGAQIVELGETHGAIFRYTVANANDISKGDLLFYVDPRTVSGANLASGAAAGIAAADKVAGDGSTSIAVFTEGLFDIVDGTGLGNGTMARISGGNYIVAATAAQFLSGMVLCKTLEAGSPEEAIVCKLMLV